jgi:hypothetical protein
MRNKPLFSRILSRNCTEIYIGPVPIMKALEKRPVCGKEAAVEKGAGTDRRSFHTPAPG